VWILIAESRSSYFLVIYFVSIVQSGVSVLVGVATPFLGSSYPLTFEWRLEFRFVTPEARIKGQGSRVLRLGRLKYNGPRSAACDRKLFPEANS
jgi:hypothetical protein